MLRASCIGLIAALGAWAQSPGSNAAGMEFVRISAGQFLMGCSESDADCAAEEKPVHQVEIAKAFEIGKYEVTQAQWRAVMGSNPSTIKGEDRPVETVSKNDAHSFIEKLNAGSDGYHYRLPSEAEWEYAARAGSSNPLPQPLDDYAWYAGNSGDETHPVGQKKPNAWGLYDMLGNVREWVEDTYSRYADGSDPAPQAGRGGRGDGGYRRGGRGGIGGPRRQLPVARGGGWDNPAGFVRVSSRYHYYGPTLRVSDIGFRVVREPVSGGSNQ